MASPDTRGSGWVPIGPPITLQKDYTFTPENVEERLYPYITSPDELPVVDKETLAGKVGVITGSTRGIGSATARLFAEYGMKVVINGRLGSEKRGQALIDLVENKGGEAIFVPTDVSTPEGAAQLIKQAKEQFGSVDIVVNNVGVREDDLMMRMEPSKWYNVMRANADSAFFVTQAAVQAMIRNKPRGGMIVSVSSVGQEGFPGQVAYAASKRAMEAIADVTAQEYASRDIKTSVLRLGLTGTDLTSNMTPEQKQTLLDALPSHREFTPDEVAPAIVFLASRQESGHVLTMA